VNDDEKDRAAGRMDPPLAESLANARRYQATRMYYLADCEVDYQVDRVLRTGLPGGWEAAQDRKAAG
jgi:hypothetical protein